MIINHSFLTFKYDKGYKNEREENHTYMWHCDIKHVCCNNRCTHRCAALHHSCAHQLTIHIMCSHACTCIGFGLLFFCVLRLRT